MAIQKMYSPNLVGAVIGFDADVVEKACADGVIPAVKIFDEWRISEQIVSAICNYGISTPSTTTSTAKPDAEQNDASVASWAIPPTASLLPDAVLQNRVALNLASMMHIITW